MTAAEFAKALKNGKKGAFIFYGEENYLKRYYIDLAKKTVTGQMQDEFNCISFTGEDKNITELCAEVMDAASMTSISEENRFLLVENADLRKPDEKSLDALEELFEETESLNDCMIIFNMLPELFDAGTQKYPSKALLRLQKSCNTVAFPRESEQRLVTWVQRHFSAEKIVCDDFTATDIVSFVGHDMTSLNNEINKLVYYVKSKGRDKVTKEDVYEAASGNSEIDAFDLSNAIMNCDNDKAFFILNDMKKRKEAPELILGSVMRVYTDLYSVKVLAEAGLPKQEIAKKLKMHEYKTGLYLARAERINRKALDRAISVCHEADIDLKTSALNGYTLIEVLVLKLSMLGRMR